MERAIIYTRVSTDEQNNGYSPADQKEKLYRYCENRNIEVVGFYHDDESGKSFNRPEWKKIMDFLKRNKNKVNTIYFLKWDRFSRNTTEAYAELTKLKKLNVEAVAIEQPLNLEIPEQKVMLALYLTAPEVDNDRRALNITYGIRRGKKEGRWLGGCPLGYKNRRNELNRPIISPEGGEIERLVKLAFKEFSTGLYSTEDLRKEMNRKGLKCSRNAFYNLIRNRVYIGEIFVPAYKNEPAEYVKGQHEPIVDSATFYKCQEILEGRKKKVPQTFKQLRDEFPLRGYLFCAKCGWKLTASSSKGRNNRYPYYHCLRECPERHKAEIINESFEKLLGDISFRSNRLKLLSEIIKEKISENNKINNVEIDRINRENQKLKNRLLNARTLMLDGEISADEYKEIKVDIQAAITNLTFEQEKYEANIFNLNKKIDESRPLQN